MKKILVKFVAGMPVLGATVLAKCMFSGFKTTLIVSPKSKLIPMPGERWYVEMDLKPISVDRKLGTAIARVYPLSKFVPLEPVVSASPDGKLEFRDAGRYPRDRQFLAHRNR